MRSSPRSPRAGAATGADDRRRPRALVAVLGHGDRVARRELDGVLLGAAGPAPSPGWPTAPPGLDLHSPDQPIDPPHRCDGIRRRATARGARGARRAVRACRGAPTSCANASRRGPSRRRRSPPTQSIGPALVGVDTVFDRPLDELEPVRSMRPTARPHGLFALRAAVGRTEVVYLGGLGGARGSRITSPHGRRSGEILRSSGVPAIEFRASIVIGSEARRSRWCALVEKLP